VERDDAVERLRRSRQRADGFGEGAIGDVSAEQMDLLAWRAGRIDNEARVVATATQKPAPTLCLASAMRRPLSVHWGVGWHWHSCSGPPCAQRRC
jgi:hypothetical protein